MSVGVAGELESSRLLEEESELNRALGPRGILCSGELMEGQETPRSSRDCVPKRPSVELECKGCLSGKWWCRLVLSVGVSCLCISSHVGRPGRGRLCRKSFRICTRCWRPRRRSPARDTQLELPANNGLFSGSSGLTQRSEFDTRARPFKCDRRVEVPTLRQDRFFRSSGL